MSLEQLRTDLINLTALHYRILLGEDVPALSGEIPTMDDLTLPARNGRGFFLHP